MMCSHMGKSVLPIQVPQEFIDCINQYNEGYIGQQISFINHGLGYILKKHVRHTKPTSRQLTKAKEWCKRYNITVNNECIYLR